MKSERVLAIAGLLLLSCASVGSISAQTVESTACAHPLDFPLRAVHVGGNWGGTRQTVERWEADRSEPLIPLDFIEYLRDLHVNWVGFSVALHYEDSMDSTVERAYSKHRNVPTFSDDALRQLIREFRQHGFDVYLTLAFESHEAYAAERPAQRWQLGDPGQPETGVPPDDPMYAPPIKPEFWPWRPDHPDHARFVQEFWSTYTEQALFYARIAQQEGVRIYSLGTETDRLFRTRSAGNYWVNDFGHELRLMTSRVREVYDGLLTYDMHYSTFMDSDESHRLVYDYFWQDLDLDLVGVSAWFPLAESSPSTVMSVETLRHAYEGIIQNYLIPLAVRNSGRPIVFLEYGTIDTVEGPADPSGFPEVAQFVFSDLNENGVDDGRETQANLFHAFFETMDHYPGLVNGAFFWDNWIASNELWQAGYWRKQRNYDFRNKPGEEIVRTQHGRFEQQGAACSEPDAGDPSNFPASALAGQRLTLFAGRDGSPEYITLIFRSGDRFEETRLDQPGTAARPGRYDYQRIGPHKGWLTLDYDDGESCVIAIAFTSATSGTSSHGCSGGSSGRGSFELRVDDIFVPVILTSAGRNNSFFTSELTLTNRGTREATLRYTYKARDGRGSGTATDSLAPGRQTIQSDAIEYLAGLGIPIPNSGNHVGTLRVEVSGSSRVSVVTRTTTDVPEGRAGLAYPGIAQNEGFQEAVYLCGLRQDTQDRSNVAFQNMGAPGDGSITLKTTVYSGEADDTGSHLVGEETLPPGGFHQYNEVLKAFGSPAQGYVKVEKVEGDAPFYAYGVINDNFNSDGSFVFPITESSLVGSSGQTLPVIIETGNFQSELTVTNFSTSEKELDFSFVADAVDTGDDTATFSLRLKAGEQTILPDIVADLRGRNIAGIGPAGRAFVGALFATPAEGDMRGILIGARTGAPDGRGGQYSLFYNGVPYGSASVESAWIYGLQQNAENRSNLALVNTGEIDESSSTFEITIYDGSGDSGPRTRSVTIGAHRWAQINGILDNISQGYVQVRKTSGNNPFITYGVINDGGRPGERSGDGAFLLSQE